MTTADTRRPLWQRTWVRVTGSIAALALVAGASAAGTALASPHTVTNRPAANSAPAHPQPAKQAPAKAAKPARPQPQPTKTIIVQQPAPKVIIQQPAAPAAPAPASSLHNVGNQVWASAATSDAFAWNVVAAWDGTPGVKYVYSPVTGQTYAMTYQVIGTGVGSVIATGGNGAYVQF
jgi:hypothetical protein